MKARAAFQTEQEWAVFGTSVFYPTVVNQMLKKLELPMHNRVVFFLYM